MQTRLPHDDQKMMLAAVMGFHVFDGADNSSTVPAFGRLRMKVFDSRQQRPSLTGITIKVNDG